MKRNSKEPSNEEDFGREWQGHDGGNMLNQIPVQENPGQDGNIEMQGPVPVIPDPGQQNLPEAGRNRHNLAGLQSMLLQSQ
jgi:hypothetical protein